MFRVIETIILLSSPLLRAIIADLSWLFMNRFILSNSIFFIYLITIFIYDILASFFSTFYQIWSSIYFLYIFVILFDLIDSIMKLLIFCVIWEDVMFIQFLLLLMEDFVDLIDLSRFKVTFHIIMFLFSILTNVGHSMTQAL